VLQAWITSSRGSLYFAAPATAYNLETLRTHVRALRDEEAARTCLSLSLGAAEDGVATTRVSALVAALTLEGIHVRLSVDEAEAPPTLRRRRRPVALRRHTAAAATCGGA
jgi:hypothetical protein